MNRADTAGGVAPVAGDSLPRDAAVARRAFAGTRPSSVARVVLALSLLVSLSACTPLWNSLSKGPGQQNVAARRQHARDADVVALIRYANTLNTQPPDKLHAARERARVAYKRHPRPATRLRLAVSLCSPPTTDANLHAARRLLREYLRREKPFTEPGRFMPLALLLLQQIQVRTALAGQLQRIRANRAVLKRKLEALTQVEQKMNRVDQSTAGQ